MNEPSLERSMGKGASAGIRAARRSLAHSHHRVGAREFGPPTRGVEVDRPVIALEVAAHEVPNVLLATLAVSSSARAWRSEHGFSGRHAGNAYVVVIHVIRSDR